MWRMSPLLFPHIFLPSRQKKGAFPRREGQPTVSTLFSPKISYHPFHKLGSSFKLHILYFFPLEFIICIVVIIFCTKDVNFFLSSFTIFGLLLAFIIWFGCFWRADVFVFYVANLSILSFTTSSFFLAKNFDFILMTMGS